MSDKKLNWNNLLYKCCPKCGHKISTENQGHFVMCSNNRCDFFIAKKRYSEICENMRERQLKNF